MGFSGEYFNNIDAKGRVVIPIKLREQLTDGFVITKGLAHCAFIFKKEKYDQIEKDLSVLPSLTDKNARAMQQIFIGSKIDGEFDSQGRVGLSQSIREYANLQKEVVIIGIVDRIEIWDKQSFNEFINSVTDSEEFSEKIIDLKL